VGEESVSQKSGYQVMLSCQSALLAVVDGYWGEIDFFVQRYLLENPAVDAYSFRIVTHCEYPLDKVYGLNGSRAPESVATQSAEVVK
jgi:hypothetical protein